MTDSTPDRPMPGPQITFGLNGRKMAVDCDPATPLVTVLRDLCGLKGVKLACSRAVCGSCTVLVDGRPGASCALFAYQVEGAELLTVEGLSQPGAEPHPIQAAFTARSAFQCGFCTGGMMMLTKALLDSDPDPDRATIVEWISSNVCRCTGYAMIIEAVQDAARLLRAKEVAGD